MADLKISDLLDDCIEGCAQQLIKDSGELPYDKAGFDKARDLIRAEIADKVLASAIKLEQILSLRHEIAKKMKQFNADSILFDYINGDDVYLLRSVESGLWGMYQEGKVIIPMEYEYINFFGWKP